jgi:hypothetical protein
MTQRFLRLHLEVLCLKHRILHLVHTFHQHKRRMNECHRVAAKWTASAEGTRCARIKNEGKLSVFNRKMTNHLHYGPNTVHSAIEEFQVRFHLKKGPARTCLPRSVSQSMSLATEPRSTDSRLKCVQPGCIVVFGSNSPETVAMTLAPCNHSLCPGCLDAIREYCDEKLCPLCRKQIESSWKNIVLTEAAELAQ